MNELNLVNNEFHDLKNLLLSKRYVIVINSLNHERIKPGK